MNVRIGIFLAALAIGGCGDNQKGAGGSVEMPESAREWLAKKGYNAESIFFGMPRALKNRDLEAIKKYVVLDAANKKPYVDVAPFFVGAISKCWDNLYLVADEMPLKPSIPEAECVAIANAFLDAGLPPDIKLSDQYPYDIFEVNENFFASNPRLKTPENLAAVEKIQKLVKGRMKK